MHFYSTVLLNNFRGARQMYVNCSRLLHGVVLPGFDSAIFQLPV